jgi:hypothetical protein
MERWQYRIQVEADLQSWQFSNYKNVVSDFPDYLNVSQNVKVEVEEKSSLSGWKDIVKVLWWVLQVSCPDAACR